jgi:hypothetical protein
MKYLSILALVALSACNSTPKTFICMTALTPLGGIQIDTSNPEVKERRDSLEFTTPQGNVLVVPKALCVEVRESVQ